ncbi:hypothetical protein VPH35_071370 [Triticum aestivum]
MDSGSSRRSGGGSGHGSGHGSGSGSGSGSRGRSPRLERRNAAKHIDYEVGAAATSVSASWSTSSSERSPGARPTRSLDLAARGGRADFRINGSAEGEVDELCRSLGLSGPEDFAIPVAAWEARKARSSSDLLARPRPDPDSSAPPGEEPAPVVRTVSAPEVPWPAPHSFPDPIPEESIHSSSASTATATDSVDEPIIAPPEESPKATRAVAVAAPVAALSLPSPRRGGGEVGIRGVRPPVLSPPPPITGLAPPPARQSSVAEIMSGSAWDIVNSFAPTEENSELRMAYGHAETSHMSDTEEDNPEENDEGLTGLEGELKGWRVGETFEGFTGTSSLSTTNDDDASSTNTEAVFVISPNGKFKRNIKSWMRGALLGSGSFGMVYEGISDEGAFFAVKEVSLLDQGSNAQQSILSLEQEIALLSQFEHENIVQYYGTDKEESKLYIFIELVTQGSLSSLYQKYKLRDSQVSAYTRQILNGLVYLHERNVVHRDIKCANILVHANGSVKLADFGLAKEMSKINMLRSCKGSVYWMAPEVVNPRKTYGPAADMWSLGCTVLEMLTRQIPYPNVEWTNAFFMIGKGEQPPIPSHLSAEAQDFIRQCVRVDPDERPSASQLLAHPFVNRPLRASFDSLSPPINRP